MARFLASFGVAAALAAHLSASSQSALVSNLGGPATPAVHALGVMLGSESDELAASLERIAKRSRLWREAVAAAGSHGRQALVVTPKEVAVADTTLGIGARPFDKTVLAGAAPVPRDGFRVDRVLVVVNVDLIERAHLRRGSLPAEMHSDLDRILVHEVYGHALPYLLAGDMSGRCPDPQPGERAVDACAIQRENAVRAELGLGRRIDSGLAGLLLTRNVSY